MLKHLLDNSLNTIDQHRFIKGRSCLTNLLETFESWTEDVDQGHSVDFIFLKSLEKEVVAETICVIISLVSSVGFCKDQYWDYSLFTFCK